MSKRCARREQERSNGPARAAGRPFSRCGVERYRGHSLADPAKYRRKDEPRAIPVLDPIERQRQRLLDSGQADEALLKRIDAEVRALVTEAAEHAAQSPEPGAAELCSEVLK